MIRARILPFVFLVAAPALFAQQSVTTENNKSTVLTLPRSPEASCPVGMQARRGVGLPVAMIAGPFNEKSPKGFPASTQRIQLTMTNRLAHEIVGAQFVVHGYSNNERRMNLANSSLEPDLAKTVDVVWDVKGKSEASRDLLLNRFTAVASIDLKSITYADGNAWHSPSADACSITLDLVMLVASSQ
jgi:hypothetical protein